MNATILLVTVVVAAPTKPDIRNILIDKVFFLEDNFEMAKLTATVKTPLTSAPSTVVESTPVTHAI